MGAPLSARRVADGGGRAGHPPRGGRTPTGADWRVLSSEFRAALDRRIETLQKLRDDLDGCIGCGCLSLERCALYNPGDKLASAGNGPQHL
ncbi:hypothetical protein DZK27_07495 [Rhodobacteraceae bacterium 63075]|nr:hypothetical protein DZK27_07495 [Rhodobacteraceae bacterium 63075]